MFRYIIVIAAAVVLSGCAAQGYWRVDSAGSPVQSIKALQTVDLPVALNPAQIPANGKLAECINYINSITHDGKCDSIISQSSFDLFQFLGLKNQTTRDREGSDGSALQRLRLEWALQAFYDRQQNIYGSKEDRRNRVQQRLITASDANCEIFAENLYGVQATGNAVFGTAATSLGGAGSIVAGVDTARLLSGLAGIASGVRAELNQDYFRNLWVEALIKGIETDRDQRRSDMLTRQSDTISHYPVEAAIADAIRYNSACSLVSGLKDVNQAVVIASDPVGLKAFQDVYSRAGFDAKFNLSVSNGNHSNRLSSPAGSAVASSGINDISDELRSAAIIEAAAEITIKANTTDDVQKNVLADIHSSFTRISGDGDGNLLQPYMAQLAQFQTDYGVLMTRLVAAKTQQEQDDLHDRIRAADATADVVRRAAIELIYAVEAHINDVVAQHPSPLPSQAASPKPTATPARSA